MLEKFLSDLYVCRAVKAAEKYFNLREQFLKWSSELRRPEINALYEAALIFGSRIADSKSNKLWGKYITLISKAKQLRARLA